jgi:hypothetical protein
MSQYDIICLEELELAKHHLQISLNGEIATPEKNPRLYRSYFRSIRSKVLQKLAFIYWEIFIGKETPVRERVKSRLEEKGLPDTIGNIAFELQPKDIQDLIGCSERTAKEYICILRQLYLGL